MLGDAFAVEEEAVLGDAQPEVLPGDAQSEHAFSFQDEAVLGGAEPESMDQAVKRAVVRIILLSLFSSVLADSFLDHGP